MVPETVMTYETLLFGDPAPQPKPKVKKEEPAPVSFEPLTEVGVLKMLRDYQLDVINKAREKRSEGHREIVLQAETGAGKTRCAAYLFWLAQQKGVRALFLADTKELIDQADAELWNFGIPHGIIAAGYDQEPARIYVASKPTLVARCMGEKKRMELPRADLVIVDECHVSLARDWLRLLRHYQSNGATVIGLSATPARMDGRPLSQFYRALVSAIPPSQLINRGFVVPTRVFAPYRPNLKGVKKSGGEYNNVQLAEKMDKQELVGDIIHHWKRCAENRQTIVYAVNIDHALHIRDEFRKAGVTAEEVDGKTKIVERTKIFDDFRACKFKVLVNVGIAKQGTDLPMAGCIVLARPTLSYVFFRQAVGRGKRPHPGKKDCILLDHAGACWRHGMPDSDVEWSIDAGRNINKEMTKKNQAKEKKPKYCPKCHAMFSNGNICPSCGHLLKREVVINHNKAGQLIEVTEIAKQDSELDKKRYWGKCLASVFYRGQNVISAKMMFYNKFRHWPDPSWPNVPGIGDNYRKVIDVYPDFADRIAAARKRGKS
jgi:DNA repair protein RadD